MSLVRKNDAVPSAPPAAVLLDIDNTLYRYDPAHQRAQADVVARASAELNVSPERVQSAWDVARKQVKARLGASAASHSRLLYAMGTLEELGLQSQPALTLALEQEYWRSFMLAMEMVPGVAEFLDELRIQGIPVAAVTDLTLQIQLRKLVFLGLDTYIDFVVASEETGVDKPDPANFELALAKLGQPSAERVWMIGDNEHADIQGAKQIGAIACLRCDVPAKATSSSADLRFSDFHDLSPLLVG